MTERSTKHATFTIERTFAAAPARVFAAYADAKSKARWFGGPEGWGKSNLKLDFKVGGRESESGGPPGISPGTVLHEFELPDLDGRQHLRSEWQGQCLLMIFVSPYCRSSRALLADLVALRSSAPASWPLPVLVSTGSIEENRRLSRSRAGASWRGVETICSRTPSTTRSGCSGSTST